MQQSQDMPIVDLLALCVVCGLATWRLASLLHTEDAFAWLRRWIKIGHDADKYPVLYPDTFWGRQFQCFWCLSNWASIPVCTMGILAVGGMSAWKAVLLDLGSIAFAIWLEKQVMRYQAR